jgi:HK97 family phage major capsid protein
MDAHSAADGALFGGLTFSWIGEGGTISATDPKLARVKFTIRKLCLLAKSSNELVEDTPIGQQIEQAVIQGAPFALDYCLLNGTGAGQPRGVLRDPALVVVTKETDQEADSITYQNVVDMFSRLHPACLANAIWLAHPSTIPQLTQMAVAVGVGGQLIPAFQNSNGSFSLLTRPVVFTELVPVLGDQGDISLVDLTQYGVALRKDLTIERSQHTYFTTDELAWRGIVRCDGQGLWKGPYTPRNGSTLSWAVALEARA